MDATFAALLGAVIGGLLSVLASWLAQRVQAKAQWLSQEILRRQQLYSDFVEAAARCFGDALMHDEPDPATLAKFYGDIGRVRLQSSEDVVREAYLVSHKILSTYGDANRNSVEIRELLSRDAVELFSDFGDACRAELQRLQPEGMVFDGPLEFRIKPKLGAASGSSEPA